MNPICVIHPSLNIFQYLINEILLQGNFEDTIVIFPHTRAVRFFEYYMSKSIQRPILMPYVKSFEEWVLLKYASIFHDPRVVIGELDQAYLAYLAYLQVFTGSSQKVEKWEDFYPWSFKLAQVFKEFDLALLSPRKNLCPPDWITSVKLIPVVERLGELYEAFNYLLEKRGFTTESKVIRSLAEINHSLYSEPCHVVGFYGLSKAEEKIFKNLWESGANFYWHADPEKLPALYQEWRANWGAPIRAIVPEKTHKTHVSFFESHDLHSQLKELKKRLPDLDSSTPPDKFAIIVLSKGSLIPLLYSLPSIPVNITLGYPLRLSGLYAFLKNAFQLIKSKDYRLGYRTKNLIEIFKSPYGNPNINLENTLKEMPTFVTRDNIFTFLVQKGQAQLMELVEEFFREIIDPIENANTPRELAASLRGLIQYILKKRQMGLVETELIYEMQRGLVEVLEGSIISDLVMDKRGLLRLVEDIVWQLSVPFEGEPLEGLQVMGLLETRLLSFEEVFILDLNEGVLPDVEEVNPILPAALRELLGLGKKTRGEEILEYYFDRVFSSSKKVHLFWQLKTTQLGRFSLEGKKVPSRYVQRIIWEMEKKQGIIFEESPLKELYSRSSIEIEPRALLRPAYLKKAKDHIDRLTTKLATISPSSLEVYIQCPLRFFYENILNIQAKETGEEFSHWQLGEATHRALEEFYRRATSNTFPHIIRKNDLDFDELYQLFEENLINQPFYKILPEEKRFLLTKATKFRLFQYFINQPEVTEIIALEHKIEKELDTDEHGKIKLKGIIDRIDKRDGVYIIIDYKTGYFDRPKSKKMIQLSCSQWLIDTNYSQDKLIEIYNTLGDLQLLFYMYLLTESKGTMKDDTTPMTACYVDLRSRGEEVFLVKPNESKGANNMMCWIKKEFQQLVRYIIGHMTYAEYWYPATDTSICNICPYNRMCKYSTV